MITRSNCILFDMNGEIQSLFESEVTERVGKKYTHRQKQDILESALIDTAPAVEYAQFMYDTKVAVKKEIEAHLGKEVDVGFNPDKKRSDVTARVGDLEAAQSELNEALTMILEGVTE